MPVLGTEEPHKFEAWCQQELSKLLQFPVDEELVSYLLSMQTAKDMEEYLTELLGKTNPRAIKFQKEFFSRWHPPQRVPSPPTPQEWEMLEEVVRPQQEDMVLFCGGKEGEGAGGGKQKGRKKNTSSSTLPPGFPPGLAATQKDRPTSTRKTDTVPLVSLSPSPPPGFSSLSTTSGSGGRVIAPKKQKFVPLMSSEGQSRVTLSLPGRHVCQCLAQKHDLINNCVECGRIVCAQEGSGPCVFCGSLVVSSEEEQMLAKDSKKAQKIKEKLVKQYQLKDGERAFEHFKKVQGSTGLEKAVQHKDKLLDFDQTSAQRTHVLDDERDYFSVEANSWLTSGEKQVLKQREDELREKRYGSRRNKAVTLDFAGRRVVEEEEKVEMYDESSVKDLLEAERRRRPGTTQDGIFNPSTHRPKFKFTAQEKGGKKKLASKRGGGGGGEREDEAMTVERQRVFRLQDRELQEMVDEGKCLSMHQPWASLLVAGIKRAEGRTWYSTHRGRLWIAAASKKPPPDEIKHQEDFYRALYGDEGLQFPTDYPTGCLLGCVDMRDCLSQEEYREKFPEGESESPYVFVCENPQQLIVKLPVRGQHKIWRLPKGIHTTAKLSCRPSL